MVGGVQILTRLVRDEWGGGVARRFMLIVAVAVTRLGTAMLSSSEAAEELFH